MHQPGVELVISQSQAWRPNHYTTKPPKNTDNTKFSQTNYPTDDMEYSKSMTISLILPQKSKHLQSIHYEVNIFSLKDTWCKNNTEI